MELDAEIKDAMNYMKIGEFATLMLSYGSVEVHWVGVAWLTKQFNDILKFGKMLIK